MVARNFAHQGLMHRHTVCFNNAGELFGELAAMGSDSALRRYLRQCAAFGALAIDEIDYLTYSNRPPTRRSRCGTRSLQMQPVSFTQSTGFCIDIEDQSYRHKEGRERATQLGDKRKKVKIMSHWHLPSGHKGELSFVIPKHWSTTQAEASVHLLYYPGAPMYGDRDGSLKYPPTSILMWRLNASRLSSLLGLSFTTRGQFFCWSPPLEC